MKKFVVILALFLISNSSFAKFADGKCLQRAKAIISISYCSVDASVPYRGLSCGWWGSEQNLEWKYSADPKEEYGVPEIRAWTYVALDKAESSGNKKLRPESADRLMIHIPQFLSEAGERFLELENIGWNLKQRYEIFPDVAGIGIDSLKSEVEINTPINDELVKSVSKSDPKSPIWFVSLTLSEPVYSECKDLKSEK